jgi:hypothetical protein
MREMRTTAVLLAHATAGWVLCFATMAIGLAAAGLQTALIVHAIGAPIYFFAVSRVYFHWFPLTTPLQTALAFVGFVVVMDFFLVALVINRSLAMFESPLGTWIPFALIFLSTWLTGLVAAPRQPGPQAV